MRWIKNSIALLWLCVATVLAPEAAAERSSPWAFENLVAFTIPSRDVIVRRIDDGRSVELRLGMWNDKIEDVVRKSLSGSPLLYRLHPDRQSTMDVEIYSLSSVVDFSSRTQGKQTHILIGEVRAERVAAEILEIEQSASPLPQPARNALRSGDLQAVGRHLRALPKAERSVEILHRARLAALKVVQRRSRWATCPTVPTTISDSAIQESAFLAAWCRSRNQNPPQALDLLGRLRATELPPALERRAAELESRLIAGEIFSVSRNNLPVRVAARVLMYRDHLRAKPADDFLLETVSANLLPHGFGDLFSDMVQQVLAVADEKRLATLSPVMAETYFALGQPVRASDTASYFLAKRQPSWLEGRLRRVLGKAMLKEGNWSDGAKELQTATALLIESSTEEQLLLAEALLRAGQPVEQVRQLLDGVARDGTKRVDADFENWFSRIWGENELRSGRLPELSVLEALPAHVLYREAVAAKERGDARTSAVLIKLAQKRSGSWGKVAAMAAQVALTRQKVERMKKVLEVE